MREDIIIGEKIYYKFIKKNSVFRIDLPAKIKSTISKHFKDTNPDKVIEYMRSYHVDDSYKHL